MDFTMAIPGMHPGGVLENPLASQFGQLSLQDRAFLDAFNRQEQQELHGVPRPGPVDPTSLLGQIEQVSRLTFTFELSVRETQRGIDHEERLLFLSWSRSNEMRGLYKIIT